MRQSLRVWALVIAVVVVIADQLSKWWIVAGVFDRRFWESGLFGELMPVPLRVLDFFNLVLVGNTGVSFGLLRGAGGRWFLIVLTLAIVVVLLVWLWRTGVTLTALNIGLIVGGAVGNMVDRVRLGAVVDFLDFHAFGYHWPAFNLADSAIVVGVAVFVVEGLLGPRSDSR